MASGTLAPWVEALESRTRQLGGTVASTGYHQRSLVVPFTTSRDLVEQFNRLFADGSIADRPSKLDDPAQEVTSTLTIPDLGQIPFHLALHQKDWIFASRTHLTYDLDLQQLPPAIWSGRCCLPRLVYPELSPANPLGHRSNCARVGSA